MKIEKTQTLLMTLLELLIVIAIISILCTLLLPSLKKAQAQSRSISCKGNLKQLGMAEHMYANDYSGWIIPFGKAPWGTEVWKTEPRYFKAYLGTSSNKVMRCPSASEAPTLPAYIYNQELTTDTGRTPFYKIDKIPTRVIMLTDAAYSTASYWNGFTKTWWKQPLSFRHPGFSINAVHSDGRVSSILYNKMLVSSSTFTTP